MCFMSPERLCGKMMTYDINIMKAADMWSLGIIFYFLLSGTLPFEGRTCNQLIE